MLEAFPPENDKGADRAIRRRMINAGARQVAISVLVTVVALSLATTGYASAAVFSASFKDGFQYEGSVEFSAYLGGAPPGSAGTGATAKTCSVKYMRSDYIARGVTATAAADSPGQWKRGCLAAVSAMTGKSSSFAYGFALNVDGGRTGPGDLCLLSDEQLTGGSSTALGAKQWISGCGLAMIDIRRGMDLYPLV